MGDSNAHLYFKKKDIVVVNDAVARAEEMTFDAYKMSFAQWRRRCYDVKTLVDLRPEEIVHGPFAQIIRYVGQKSDSFLGSSQYDFYKICLQDHAIITALHKNSGLDLFPFMLYIVCHELIHVIRFTTFLQSFDATDNEKIEEEARVHQKTHDILATYAIQGMETVFEFYRAWQGPMDELQER